MAAGSRAMMAEYAAIQRADQADFSSRPIVQKAGAETIVAPASSVTSTHQ